MKPKPKQVAQIHREICRKAHCEYLDKLDYFDPCIVCPNGHWGQYNASECEETDTNRHFDPLKIGFLKHSSGPGMELKKLLAKFGLKPAAGCKCNQHIVEMNTKGIEWCEENLDTIVGWLKEEAQRARLPFTALGAKILVKRAISNAKRTRS